MDVQRVVPVLAATQSLTGGSPDGTADGSLLDGLADLAGTSAVLLGHDVGLMCGLIRRGCRAVTELQQNDRPERDCADLVLVPAVGGADAAVTAIAHARRSLRPSGRIVLCTIPHPAKWLGRAIERTLRLHGFTAIRLHPATDRAVLSAELRPLGQA